MLYVYPINTFVNDLAISSLTGPQTVMVNQTVNYSVTVTNAGTVPQNSYSVSLMRDNGITISTQIGSTLSSGATQIFNFYWTPTNIGTYNLYAIVTLSSDNNLNNNQSSNYQVLVTQNLSSVTIGAGNQTARIPMDFFWRNSLFECLFYPDELGFMSGTITSLAFYNNFADSPTNGATKIWLGTTNQADLSASWIPSTQLTLVFNGNVTYPTGTNTITIPLQTPYMHTPGNLVMMVQRPMDTQYYSSSDYFLAQTVGSNRARKVQSDTITYEPANPPASATVSGQFPKTTIYYNGQAIVNDLACLSISGNTMPTVGINYHYIITVRNNGTAVQSNYTVKLMKEGGVLVGSVPGITINSLQTLDFTIPWTPTETGSTYIYGEVELTGDEIANNNQTTHLNITVYPPGTVTVTVGTGNSTGRMPMDFYWKNSLFETVYLASELNIGGLLTDIQFYNNFVTDLPNKPTNVWVGETTQTDLSAGWIPSTQLTPVFSGNVNYPIGQNNILIHLTTPYLYGGGNLVVMVERPMDTYYYSSLDVFRTQTGTVANRTRNVYSDSEDYDPANPPTATPQAMFPKATFMFITEGLGAINGTVYTIGNVPVNGATVTVAGTNLVYTTGAEGTFTFPYVMEGVHQVTATKHGYNEVTHTVTVIEDETVTVNFVITPLPQVTVSGRIVGSDQPTVGLANATISLTGYESYQATTNTTGQFSIPNVYANHTYDYVAQATGYQNATGQVVVGSTNVNMGDIVLNEFTYPPSDVQAVAVNSSLVNITWNAPTAGENITEGFEGTLFPPEGWSQIITNNGPAVGPGILPTWCQAGTITIDPPVPPHGGSYQAVMWWDYVHQDEWLITPQFVCPADADLVFWSYVYLGSTYGDHYYIKVSTDNGSTWTVLWDASTLTGGWNYYTTPIVVPLSNYAGQQIKLAWHADDPPSNDGMWYVWFVDDVSVGNAKEVLHFPINSLTRVSANETNSNIPLIAIPNRPVSRALVDAPSLRESNDTSYNITRDNRLLTGYKVWRLLQGQESNESAWTLLTTDVITATAWQDTCWGSVPDGIYKWAVKAVYTGGIMSNPAFSNALTKLTQIGTIAGTVKNQQNAPIMGATVTCGTITATTNASGAYSMQVPAGTHSVTASAPGYDSVTHSNVVVITNQTTTVNFILPPSSTLILLEDSFETYENFALTFAPWTCVDVDQSTTYGITGHFFPNCYSPMAYIIFVPSAITPPITTPGVTHTGNKIAACFASTTPPNNDWLITPVLNNPTQITFWARSYTAQFGLERFKVGVSTTGTNPSNFTIISGPNYIQVPITWTEYTYQINQTGPIYISIQCVSNDALMFCVDDVVVMGTTGSNQNIPLSSGWNLISLNVSPPDHTLDVLLAPIINQVQQIKGTDGVYIHNNPFSTLAALTDGRAYHILMSNPVNWTVSGAPIPVSTPIPLSDGWNLAAYFPTTPLVVTEAMSCISEWLIQVKGTDGVYIPGNPYSTLTTMYPGKGYWIKVNGAHNLIYPGGAKAVSAPSIPIRKEKEREQVKVLSNSLTLLARCNAAEEGDYLLARVEGELRGKEKFISPEGFPAVLMQVYTEMSGEEISFSLLKPDGSEIVLVTTLISEPGAILGDYPEFVVLESTSIEDQVIIPTQLKGCYPNPFNPSTTIVFSIGEETQVNIDIYNLKGQKVRHLTSESFSRGEHKLLWDGKDDQGRKVASGIYFAEMRTPHYKKHIKMIMTK